MTWIERKILSGEMILWERLDGFMYDLSLCRATKNEPARVTGCQRGGSMVPDSRRRV